MPGAPLTPPWRRRLFWSLLVGIIALDIVTKIAAVRMLAPRGVPHEVFGDWVRLTLVYNRGAAFGLSLGSYSRWLFLILSVVALVILARLYRSSRSADATRVISIAMVCAGAVGNMIDRIRSSQGVVDFLDVGIGIHRWPTFNVADMAVSVGAFLLAWSLWGEDRAAARAAAAARDRRRSHGDVASEAGGT